MTLEGAERKHREGALRWQKLQLPRDELMSVKDEIPSNRDKMGRTDRQKEKKTKKTGDGEGGETVNKPVKKFSRGTGSEDKAKGELAGRGIGGRRRRGPSLG